MAKKWKRSGPKKRSAAKNKKRGKNTKVQKKKILDKCTLGSVWRVQTADVETTSTGKEVLSGWKRCKIIAREDARADYPDGSVTVQYFDEESETDEPIQYDVRSFLSAADPAPIHINLVNDVATAAYLTREQPLFEQQERGELLPVERKNVSNPKKWKKKTCVNLRSLA